LSFQEPSKVADALSLIWNETHKWAKIAAAMGVDESFVKIKLKLISDRRNAIVHQSDKDPLLNTKTPICLTECEDITKFIHLCGRSIVALVR
jgi:hypothetical protein